MKHAPPPSPSPLDWPSGTGQAAALVRAMDAVRTPLGPPAQWPQALRTTLDLMLPSNAQIVLFWGPDFIAFYNDAYAPTIGRKHPGAFGRPAREHWTELWDDLGPLLERVLRDGSTFSARDRPFRMNRHGRLEEIFFDLSYSPVREAGGRVGGVLCIVTETTDRVLGRRALRETNDQLRLAQAAGGIGTFLLDIASNTLDVSAEFCRIFGVPVRQHFSARKIDALRLSENEPMSTERTRADGSARLDVEYRIRRADDHALRWIARRAELVPDAAGQPMLMRGVVQDVTATKQAVTTLRQSEARFRTLAQAAPNQVWTATADGRLDWFNDQVYAYSGLGFAQLERKGWAGMVHPDEITAITALWQQALNDRAPCNAEFRLRRHDGVYRWHLVCAQPDAPDDDGTPVRWIGTSTDINDQKDAQARLEQRVMERTRDRDRLWALTTDIMLVADLDGHIAEVNPAWEALLGWTEAELIGRPVFDFMHPEDVPASRAALARLAHGEQTLRFENRCLRKDGSARTVAWNAVTDAHAMHAVGRDVTALRESEARLRQSQKMEAIGQLTGGIAHDFNNLLQGITGSIEVVRRRIALGRTADLDRFMNSAAQSAHRAAALIQRLLAFSRRQSLDPRAVDVNALIASMEDLLRRTLGEQVRLSVHLDPAAGAARGDEGQLESVILNLAINARDAMPDGGELTIATGRATVSEADARQHEALSAGDYLVVTVSDTGSGMPSDVLAKVFDPFFTTKPIGQGTGLGLSMVYGFAQQSHGHVRIDSRVGHGTRVTLALPVAAAPTLPSEAEAAATVPQGRGEVVLVVEDDPGVRLLVLDVLADLGYRTLEAADGASAMPILESAQRIDLLVSDVGLPGMNGRQLADFARQQRPGLRVLFMTGYAEHATTRAEFLAPGMALIAKPFSIDDFAQRVEQIVRHP